jgi:pyridoxal 5'-phosphate synthase pdxT subunit
MVEQMKIGVLALQGAFVEHIHMLNGIGAAGVEVRLPRDLGGLSGLIIPGGESTTINKLMAMYDFIDPIREFAATKPVWGTCAGMIVMAERVVGEAPSLALMDITVERNAFGRQVDSFEEGLHVARLGNGDSRPFPGVFIRAPKLVDAGKDAAVIARLENDDAVAALQGLLLATAFHPELSADDRFHRFFLSLVKRASLQL